METTGRKRHRHRCAPRRRRAVDWGGTHVILVTGASGQTGRSVVDVLAATGEHVRAFDVAHG